MCKMKVGGVQGTSQVQPQDTGMSGTIMKRDSSVKDVSSSSSVSKSESVSTKSESELNKDQSKIQDGKPNFTTMQKIGNFFSNIVSFFQNIGISKENDNAMTAFNQKVQSVTKSNETKIDVTSAQTLLKPNPYQQGTKEHTQFETVKSGFFDQCEKEFSPENAGGTNAINTYLAKQNPTVQDAKDLQKLLFVTGFGKDNVRINVSGPNERKLKEGIESGDMEKIKLALEGPKGASGLIGELSSNLSDTMSRFKLTDTYDKNVKEGLPIAPKAKPLMEYKPWKVWE